MMAHRGDLWVKVVLALLGILASSRAQAAGETVPSFGLSPGASPNTLCIFDKSVSRPCVPMGALDSVNHIYSPATSSASLCNSIALSGAVGDGITDDTAVINAYLATFTKGGCVSLPAGKWYLINTANLSIPAGVIVEGASNAQENLRYTGDPQALGGGFLINPSYTVFMNQGSQLLRTSILRAGLIANPTAAQSNAAVAQWGTETSVGITLPANFGNQLVEDVFVVGFNTCIQSRTGAFYLYRVSGDCYNGLDSMQSGDFFDVVGVRFEPFYSLKIADHTTWGRPGIAFNYHGGTAGCRHTLSSTFMFATGLMIDQTGGCSISDSLLEFHDSLSVGISNTKGVRLIAGTGVIFNNVSLVGYDNGVDAVTGEYQLYGMGLFNIPTQGFILDGSNATPTTITITGAATAGQTVSATITSASVTGSPLTVTYIVNALDVGTTTFVARGLANVINSNLALSAAGIFATYSNNVVSVIWPTAVTASVTAGGSMTTAIGSGTAPVGAYGEIAQANLNYASVPNGFKLNPGAGRWNIASPWLGQNASVPAAWLNVVGADGTSISHLRLSGIPWSPIAQANFSGCGATGATSFNGSSDAIGGFTETSGATTCTLTFVTPFPYTPSCVVTNPAGVALTWTVSTTQLAVSNPAAPPGGTRVDYRCALGG